MLSHFHLYSKILVGVNQLSLVTVLAALFCKLRRYPSVPPHRGIKYVREDMKVQLADINSVLNVALVAIFLRALTLLVRLFTKEFSHSLM